MGVGDLCGLVRGLNGNVGGLSGVVGGLYGIVGRVGEVVTLCSGFLVSTNVGFPSEATPRSQNALPLARWRPPGWLCPSHSHRAPDTSSW